MQPTHLADFVRDRRRAHGMNQADLALLAGVGRRFVSELEAGKPTLQLAKVDRVLAVFGKRLGLVDAARPASVHDEPPSDSKELRRG